MFKFLESLNKRNFLLATVLSYLVFFILELIAPIVVIITRYAIAKDNYVKIGMGGLILIFVVAVVGVFIIRRTVAKLGDTRPAVALFKYTLEAIQSVIIPGAVFLMLWLLQNSLATFYGCLQIICVLYVVGGIWNSIVINMIDREANLRDAAYKQNEIDKRKINV